MFSSDEEFWKSFNQLNALNGDGWRWETPDARKEHEDLFGETISEGETYFKKQYGPGYHMVIKLSKTSMEKLLFAVVESSPTVQKLADLVLEGERKRMLEAMNRIGGNRNDG